MGVPAFFRWLSRKYPSVIIECVENKKVDPDTERNIYEDGSLPNPNGIEFDNLYLDMNGIIHPCTHPEDKPAPKNEDEMMVAIFECIDRLMNIVRPRKLLYMAIDGVAPRAKMNQQRSRRFRAAKESVEKRLEIERIRSELLVKGCVLPPEKEKGEHFDSNCITPGTPFMERLSQCLHYYIHDRLNNNTGWKGLKVILSDANVPGEGEHKIMDYIRKQRSQPDHDPNTQHVLCGADADLIMLGLATHEPNFTIIREEFLPNKPKPCEICSQFGHEMDKCQGLNAGGVSDNNFKPDVPIAAEVKFIFVRLSVLREYLKKTLEMHNLPFAYNFERALDDWVFMCFFVGNDFLPHLPSLEIREGAVDRLIELYKRCIYRGGDYLTNSGEVKLEWVQLILTDLGKVEDQIFRDRQKREKMFKAREKSKRMRIDEYNSNIMDQSGSFKLTPLGKSHAETLPYIDNYKQNAANLRNSDGNSSQDVNTKEVRRGLKRTASKAQLDDDDEEEEEVHDEVRLWEEGFKDRYYESKFDIAKSNLKFRYSVALQYVRGLCWVLKYYYQGCVSWNWYFPYHYAPFASDFVNITGLSTIFDKGSKPFDPLEQLMSVFPAASSSHVPAPWAKLMSDPNSDIIDFYPVDFKIDLNGKKFAWQGVALLPFVDEKRLFKALKPYYCMLTEDEIRRNKKGECRLYVGRGNSKFKFIRLQYRNHIFDKMPEVPISIDGMRGTILKSEETVPLKGTVYSPIKGLHDITENEVITVTFRDPQYDKDFIFPAVRLPNAVDPPNVLAPSDRPDNYRPKIGFDHNLPRAYITQSGHRLLGNTLGTTRNDSPQYNSHTSNSHYRQQPYNYRVQQGSHQHNNFSRGYDNNSRNHLSVPYSSYNSQQQRNNHRSSGSNSYSHNYQQQSMQSMNYHNNYQNQRYDNYNKIENNRRYFPADNRNNYTRNRDNNNHNNYNRRYN